MRAHSKRGNGKDRLPVGVDRHGSRTDRCRAVIEGRAAGEGTIRCPHRCEYNCRCQPKGRARAEGIGIGAERRDCRDLYNRLRQRSRTAHGIVGIAAIHRDDAVGAGRQHTGGDRTDTVGPKWVRAQDCGAVLERDVSRWCGSIVIRDRCSQGDRGADNGCAGARRQCRHCCGLVDMLGDGNGGRGGIGAVAGILCRQIVSAYAEALAELSHA